MQHKQAAYDEKYSTKIRGGESFFRQADREESLIHLLRVNILKRMESSVASFALTIKRQLADVETLLAKIDAHDEAVEEIVIDDVDVDDPAFESLLVGRKVKVLLQDVDRVRWRQDLIEDRNRLATLLSAARAVSADRDAKLDALKQVIARKAHQPINDGNRKLLLFTAFTGQPRAVVFHRKEGREHCHAVWSRIDSRTMRAVQISHDHMKLRTCARELAQAYGLVLPQGLTEDRGDARFEKVRDLTAAELAVATRNGQSPETRRAEITALFRSSDNAEALRTGLERAGYMLARGDRRSFVVVDRTGEIHALARQIEGAKTRTVKERLAAISVENLPTVEQAKSQQAAWSTASDERVREIARARGAKSASDLAAKQKARRRKLDARRQQLEIVHRHERLSLRAAHKSEQGHLFNLVAARFFALFDKVPGLRSVIAPLRRNPHLNPMERQGLELDSLKRRHAREGVGLDRRNIALDRALLHKSLEGFIS